MRVIGGTFRGKLLATFRGMTIRPTADRVREAIFNILADHVQGAVVLDLFAGTGAFGIEALSRGAKYAVFVDNSKKAIATIKKNIRSCALEQSTAIIKWDILKSLNCIKSFDPAFDLVFLDPPYKKDCIKPALINLSQNATMVKGACVVIEHSFFEPIPTEISVFVITNERRYAHTLVSFLKYKP
ncbi:MAG: 16S rRNA (guanine(966)-N(2))-methyltransferase RsmD [Deltaproteobacteria bacterium]|nr:MAG: 16S rRNA (guanine(966)-N(2))-methyltransferase RsmD [Deltaproteobacteria bacterium]